MDRFILCGEKYKAIREAIATFVATRDEKSLDSALQAVKQSGDLKHRDFLLALFTEVTSGNRFKEQEKRVPPDVLSALEKFVQGSRLIKEKDIANKLIRNQLASNCPRLTVSPDQDWKTVMMAQMLVHFIVKIHTMDKTTLMQPLRMIATKPESMQDVFLPTMPQEDLKYIDEAMKSFIKKSGRGEQIQMYKCPNGHAYMIGDCGRPYYKGTCNECGKPIGGAGHTPEQGNVKVETIEEKTVTGHILGGAKNRHKIPIPERKMTPASTAVLRLFTHMAMYVGTNTNIQAISAMVVPAVNGGQLADFFWSHIVCDLEVLGNALRRSPDECVLLMHMIMDGIFNETNTSKFGGYEFIFIYRYLYSTYSSQ